MNYLKILLLILLSSFFSDIPLAKESAQFGIVQKKSKLLKSPKAISKRLPIKLNKGDTVKVLAGKNKKYFNIQFNNQNGWINKSRIIVLPKNIPSKKVSVEKNPCEDEKFLMLQSINIFDMSDNDYRYYKSKRDDCKAYRKKNNITPKRFVEPRNYVQLHEPPKPVKKPKKSKNPKKYKKKKVEPKIKEEINWDFIKSITLSIAIGLAAVLFIYFLARQTLIMIRGFQEVFNGGNNINRKVDMGLFKRLVLLFLRFKERYVNEKKFRNKVNLFLFIIFIYIIVFPDSSKGELHYVTRVIDGDTFKTSNGKTIRLIGVDTPESKDPTMPVQPFALEAALELQKLILNKSVYIDIRGRGYYGRPLGYVWVNGKSVNEHLIENGFAISHRKYPHDETKRYNKLESKARKKRVGMWYYY